MNAMLHCLGSNAGKGYLHMFSVDALFFSSISFLWLLKSTDVGHDPKG